MKGVYKDQWYWLTMVHYIGYAWIAYAYWEVPVAMIPQSIVVEPLWTIRVKPEWVAGSLSVMPWIGICAAVIQRMTKLLKK